MLLAAYTDLLTYFFLGWSTTNFEFIVLNSLQGAGDASYAVSTRTHTDILACTIDTHPLSYTHTHTNRLKVSTALFSDYAHHVPFQHVGSDSDDVLSRVSVSLVRASGGTGTGTDSHGSSASDDAVKKDEGEIQKILSELITIKYIYATIGYLAGTPL